MKQAKFGMVWQCYGYQYIDLPDDIDIEDKASVIGYLRSKWDDIPLPEGDYISGSDELDEEFVEVWTV